MGRWVLKNGVFGLAPIIQGPSKPSKPTSTTKLVEPIKPLVSEPIESKPVDNQSIEESSPPSVESIPVPIVVTEDQILPPDPPISHKKKKRKKKRDKERYVGAGWFEVRTDEHDGRESLVEKPKH